MSVRVSVKVVQNMITWYFKWIFLNLLFKKKNVKRQKMDYFRKGFYQGLTLVNPSRDPWNLFRKSLTIQSIELVSCYLYQLMIVMFFFSFVLFFLCYVMQAVDRHHWVMNKKYLLLQCILVLLRIPLKC